MRALPSSLTNSLDSGVTTLARCWLLRRADGQRLGFTDHDQNISFDGVLFRAESGLTGSAV
ncbi:MAG: DUF2163 domain-containing protein, partial [Pseudomonadota bacterium]